MSVRVGNSILNAIGNTPLLKLSNINKHLGIPLDSAIYVKLENLNPGGSKKDRVAKQIILDAIENNQLQQGQPIVELTSGNTGTGLAIVAGSLGYSFTAVMSKGNSRERAQMMTALGANVVLVDQYNTTSAGQGVSGLDLQLVEEETCRIVQETNAFRADQFTLPGSYRAHYLHTGPECWNQLLEFQQDPTVLSSSLSSSKMMIDAFVDFVGTGGTFVGISKYLKEQDSNIQCHVVEPQSYRVLDPTAMPDSSRDGGVPHKIQGGGYSKTFQELPLFHHDHHSEASSSSISSLQSSNLVDGYLSVSDEEAIETTRLLATTEGIFGGFSSGANVAAAAQLLRRDDENIRNVLAIICDSGLKYLSTDLYQQ